MRRESSRALQGIAVLLMLFHHFFLYAWLFDDVPGFLAHPGFTEHLAWCGRICVGIFSFVSGYGMYHALKGKDTWRAAFAGSGKRIARLYGRLWFVLGLYLLLWTFVFRETIDWSQLLMNLTALDTTYNATWWFVREYLWMLLLAPFARMLLNGRGGQRAGAVIAAAAGVAVILILRFVPAAAGIAEIVRTYAELVFLIIFAEGYLAAFLQERLAKRRKGKKIPAWAGVAVAAVLVTLAVVCRFYTTKAAADAKQDILIVPVFICGMALLFQGIPATEKATGFFGKYSLYLWLVHGLVWQRTFVFAKHLGHPVVYYLFELLLSLAVAFVLETAERWIVKTARRNRE